MSAEQAEIVGYRIERAKESLQAAQLLHDNGHRHAAINRLYYACFYAATALLLTEGLSSAKHAGVLALFNKNWIKPGRFPSELGKVYNTLFGARQEADYADMAAFTEVELTDWLLGAGRFVVEIEKAAAGTD